ncbi:dual specificity protein phosphatase family protein [bacterium]|nr:dual specificity protein phosphatase family protein [bacterium]MBU1884894.1 dual specificity protein phosphatase family protein [bacterium]
MYVFSSKLEAKSALKERFVWLLFMGLVFFLLYGAANQWAFVSGPHISLAMKWEENIPFIPAFIVPYMSSDLMFVIAFLLPYTRFELRVLAARVLFIVLVSVLVFVIFPLKFGFEKPETEAFSFLFNLLHADLPYNQLPSLHISFAIVLWTSMRKYLTNPLVKYSVAVWFWLIALSTLFVYQHHFVDLPTGALVGVLALYVIKEDQQISFITQFMTPRSLKMGLYYLIAASISMILAFVYPSLSWMFLWLFISFFGVGIVYAFGLNTLLAGKNSDANVVQWIVFLPYFLGNYFSWHYYKRKLSLITQVGEGVYFGRFPTTREYESIKEKNIAYVINLATEQQIQKSSMQQSRLAFLDQTIQSPQALHEGVMLIEAYKTEGVFVHCALGLSRSVLLISAWLLYAGHTLQEVETLMQTIRQKYVKSPYMKITLEIYLDYLQTLRLGEENHADS